MKRAELNAGQHVLHATGRGWECEPYLCGRVMVLDAGQWTRSRYRSTTVTVDGADHTIPGVRDTTGSIVPVVRRSVTGEPINYSYVEFVSLGSLRGAWDDTWPAVQQRAATEKQRNYVAKEAARARASELSDIARRITAALDGPTARATIDGGVLLTRAAAQAVLDRLEAS